jgi:hypothetical protein
VGKEKGGTLPETELGSEQLDVVEADRSEDKD